jgi:hypothetical protein
MATVRDLSGNNPLGATFTDKAYEKANRTGTATPIGSVTPGYVGEIYYDSTNKVSYRSFGTANTEWIVFIPAS